MPLGCRKDGLFTLGRRGVVRQQGVQERLGTYLGRRVRCGRIDGCRGARGTIGDGETIGRSMGPNRRGGGHAEPSSNGRPFAGGYGGLLARCDDLRALPGERVWMSDPVDPTGQWLETIRSPTRMAQWTYQPWCDLSLSMR